MKLIIIIIHLALTRKLQLQIDKRDCMVKSVTVFLLEVNIIKMYSVVKQCHQPLVQK